MRRLGRGGHHHGRADRVVAQRKAVGGRIPSGAVGRIELAADADLQQRRRFSRRYIPVPVAIACDRAERPGGVDPESRLPRLERHDFRSVRRR